MVDLNLNMNLAPPADLEALNKSTTEQQINTLTVAYPELKQDAIVAYVEFYKSLGIPIGQDAIDNLVAENPVLSDPAGTNSAMAEVSTSRQNPWFEPNPFATFFVLFLEMQADLSKIKVIEAEMTSEMINTTLDMAHDLASIIKDIYETEAKKAFTSAAFNAIGGAVSVACGAKGMAKIGSGSAGVAQAQTLGSIGGGVGQLATAGDKIASGVFDLQRAELEFSKTIIENAMRVLQDRGMASSSEAQRTAEELISQLLQKLDKIIDEAMRAHGFQVH